MSLLDDSDIADALPGLDPDCHKGDRGALGVFAGAPGSTGAAVLCARAASAAGAGSVTLLVRDALAPVLSSILVSQMVRPASDPGTRRFAAVVAGPGWGVDDANARALDGLWEAATPLALDADLQPIGAFTTRIEGFFETVNALHEKGLIRSQDAVTAKMVLGVLSKRNDAGRISLTVPLTVQERRLYVGPVPLAVIPPVRWQGR